jgi:hypothetical protein
MTGMTRAGATLLAAAAAGVLIWLATQFDMDANPGYWAAMGVLAGGGLLVGLSQLRGPSGNPAAMFVIAFLPVLVVAGWVLVATQPDANEFGDQIVGWTEDVGAEGLVESLATFAGVLAFGIGLVFGLTFEPPLRRHREGEAAPYDETTAPAYDRRVAEEPTAAERREAAEERVAARERALAEEEHTVRR